MKNLLAEMERNGVTLADISQLLRCSENTVRNKINQREAFTFTEAIKIRDAFFPGLLLEYLFTSEDGEEEFPVIIRRNEDM